MPVADAGALFVNIVVFVTSMVNFNDALNHMQPVILGSLYILIKVLSPRPEDWIAADLLDWDHLFKAGAGH